jgi:hypothetical protein
VTGPRIRVSQYRIARVHGRPITKTIPEGPIFLFVADGMSHKWVSDVLGVWSDHPECESARMTVGALRHCVRLSNDHAVI